MNTYLVQYNEEGSWIPFMIQAGSIYDGLALAKSILPKGCGTCISLHEPWPEE